MSRLWQTPMAAISSSEFALKRGLLCNLSACAALRETTGLTKLKTCCETASSTGYPASASWPFVSQAVATLSSFGCPAASPPPHMVRHLGITRFCGRNSNGKYDLDVHEIRSAFLASEGLSDRLNRFRLDRINKLAAGVTPIPLTRQHLIVLHLLPVLEPGPDQKITTSVLRELKDERLLRPITPSSSGSTFNIDGIIVNFKWEADAYYGYVQLFRNGYLEAVDSQSLKPRKKGEFIIPNIGLEKYILQAFPSYFQIIGSARDSPSSCCESQSLECAQLLDVCRARLR